MTDSRLFPRCNPNYADPHSNDCGTHLPITGGVTWDSAACGVSGQDGYHPSMPITCDGETGYGYHTKDFRDPLATVEIKACDGSTDSIWIYSCAGPGHTYRYNDADGKLVGYAANSNFVPLPQNGCEQCCDGGDSNSAGSCDGVKFTVNGKTYTQNESGCISESGSFIPDGCYTQICYKGGVPSYGNSPSSTIDFGTPVTWCNLGVSYKYENGKVTKSGTAIPDGVYTRFTVQAGCIVGADLAPLPVYRPSECCDGDDSGGGSFDCSDVLSCVGSFPFAGTASSTTKLLGQDGKTYTVPTSGGGGGSGLDCDGVKSCIASFPANGTATATTQLIGADGAKYFVPITNSNSAITGSYCGGLQFSNGLLTALPTTQAAIGVNNSEYSWPPILGINTQDWLEVVKNGCKAELKINNAGLFNAVVDQFVNSGTTDVIPDGTRFLAENGIAYTVEQIAAKVETILGIPSIRARLTALEAAQPTP